MMMGVIFDVRRAMNAKCEGKDVGHDEWPVVIMDSIPVKM